MTLGVAGELAERRHDGIDTRAVSRWALLTVSCSGPRVLGYS